MVASPTYNNIYLGEIFYKTHINFAISDDKKKYLKAFIDDCVYEGYISRVVELYGSSCIYPSERKFIANHLANNLKESFLESPEMIFELVELQNAKKIELISLLELENLVVESKNACDMFCFMEFEGSNKLRLVKELGKIKDDSDENKMYFIEAIAKYYPNVLAGLKISDFAGEIASIEDESKVEECATQVVDAVVNLSKDSNPKTPENSANTSTPTIEGLEPLLPPLYKDSDPSYEIQQETAELLFKFLG